MGVREITAEEAAKRRAAALKGGPPSSGMLRDFAEGVASVPANVFDFLNKYAGNVDNPIGEVRVNPPVAGPMAERISESTAADPTRARAAGSGVGGALMALPVVAATGGLTGPVAVSSLAGGAGGGLASDEARRRGYGPVGQFVAGMAGDLGTSLLTRGAIAAPGAIYNAVSPTRRAGQYVRDLNLGTETAEDAAVGVRTAFGSAKEDVDKAYDLYRQIPSEGTTSSEPFLNLANAQKAENVFTPSQLPEVARRATKVLGEEVGVQDIERLRRGVSNTLGNQNVTPNTRRLAGQFNDVADEALQEIAAQSGPDSAAAQALTAAIAKRRALGKAFPEDSGLYDLIIAPRNLTQEEAQQAFTKFVNSADREKEIGIALQAVSGNPEAKRGLNKALVEGILNSAEETASGKVSSQLERLRKAEGVLRKAWGDKGFEHFRRLISEQATANRERGFIARYTLGTNNPTRGMALGTIAGGYLGGGPGATAGMVAGGSMDMLAQHFGPRAVREIAIHSLYDPDLYRQVTRQAPSGVKASEWLATISGALVRRGILSTSDAAPISADDQRPQR